MKIRESDLYQPIKDYFSKLGYKVNGEVKDCDLTALKEEMLIVVELKKNLSVELLAQGVHRQKFADLVYIAIPKPKRSYRNRKWQKTLAIIRKLELGLMVVDLNKNGYVDIVVSPKEKNVKGGIRKNRLKQNMINEIEGRSVDLNTGGKNKRKLMTAYREKSIQIATYLKYHETLSPKSLRKLGTDEKKTSAILYENHYGWFLRVGRGAYALSDKGLEGLKEYPELLVHYEELYRKAIVENTET